LYILTGIAFSDFAQRGGKARIICSPQLSGEDIQAIQEGYDARESLTESIRGDIDQLLANPDSRPVTEFLATLVAAGVLDIKIAFRPTAPGIFHDKLGIFEDSVGNHVSFLGSANETFSAWDINANHESFEVFRSWVGDSERDRIAYHLSTFEEIWCGNAPGITTRDFPDAARDHLLAAVVPEGIDVAADRVRQVVQDRARAASRNRVVHESTPPTPRRLQPHQLAVVQDWENNQFRGIIDHVTGAGKTVTALSIIDKWISSGRPALVLVPSELLLTQWLREAQYSLSTRDVAILLAGAGHSRRTWEDTIADFTRDMPDLGPRLTIATMATASSPAFLSRVQGGSHLLIVADEVHRIGAPSLLSLLHLEAGGRLGLSATPERYGDPNGTAAIFNFFDRTLLPTFQIKDAIAAGRLVPYDYFVQEISLSDSEQSEWDSLTQQIQRQFNLLPRRADGTVEQRDRFDRLLFARAAILKRAEAKVAAARDIIEKNYRPGDRWLVYCDTQDQLRAVRSELETTGLPHYELHSGMLGERDATLDHFINRGGILVAIKCLDEGVDIPTINRALILASSRNSREFIQRRGRVLRSAPDKFSAQIYDLLTVPAGVDPTGTRDVIVREEIRRAAEFAANARNTAVALQLDIIARRTTSSEFDITTGNFENEDD
jgi:superfamily II DNA or RNA helicase